LLYSVPGSAGFDVLDGLLDPDELSGAFSCKDYQLRAGQGKGEPSRYDMWKLALAMAQPATAKPA
jgi:hypothetical protein